MGGGGNLLRIVGELSLKTTDRPSESADGVAANPLPSSSSFSAAVITEVLFALILPLPFYRATVCECVSRGRARKPGGFRKVVVREGGWSSFARREEGQR